MTAQLGLWSRRGMSMHPRPTIAERFDSFDRDHPEVWQMFERLALELVRAGRRRYSADAIVHRIRWHFEVERRMDDFKINNDYVALYARRWACAYPEHADLFSFRERRAT